MALTKRYAIAAARMLVLCALAVGLVVGGTNWWVRIGLAKRSHGALSALPAREVAIVPGSPTWKREAKAVLLTRLEAALELYRAGRVRAILVSGIDSARDPETSAMRAWLQAHGVQERDILSDDRGYRTRETMYRAIRYYAVTDAIICTEAFAMPRTLYLARENGIDAVGYELPSRLGRVPRRVGIEALKTTLAVFEETFLSRERPQVSVARR